MLNVLTIETDEGGSLEVYPAATDKYGVMLRIVPPDRHVSIVDSVGYFNVRHDDLRKLAEEILRLLPPKPCEKCGRV